MDKKMIVFNRKQKDAYAKILDNIATAVVIALIIGISVDDKITWINGFAMGVCFVLCILGATVLRGRGNG